MPAIQIPPVLSWENPIASAKTLGSILTALFVFKYLNLFRLGLILAYPVLFISGIAEYAGRRLQKSQNGFVTKLAPAYTTVPQDKAEAFFSLIFKNVNDSLVSIQDLVFAKNPYSTFVAALSTWFLHKLSGIASVWTLALITTLTLFSVPVTYLRFQQEIDEHFISGVNTAKDHLQVAKARALERAAPLRSRINETLAPYHSKFEVARSRFAGKPNTSTPKPVSADPVATKPVATTPIADVEVPVSANTSAFSPVSPLSSIPHGESTARYTTSSFETKPINFPRVPSNEFPDISATDLKKELVKDKNEFVHAV